ncbi:MAG: EamA family transporter [Rhodospirillaceae bacterium]|nr:EamA family transporter [Rhodospirillaceae bacterium]MCA8934436.1 EamA family transporter [Rhodospirillaceae bacterium]
MKPIDLLLTLLVAVTWGLNFVIAKLGVAEMPPIFLVTLRFALVAALLVPFVRFPRGRFVPLLVLAMTLGTLHFSLMFSALNSIDASVAAVAIQTQVPFAAILSAILFKDPPGWRRVLGMVVAIGGVALLAGAPTGGSELWAIGVVVLAAMVWAVANVQMTRLGGLDGFTINGWMAMFAVPMQLAASLALEDGQWEALTGISWTVIGVIVYQAVMVVILAYGIWYRMLGRYGVNQMMAFTLLVPVFGVISGVALLGEPFSLALVVGALLTITGVGIIVLRRPRLAERPGS